MEELYNGTVSGNMVDPHPEELETESGDSDVWENQEYSADVAMPDYGNEESGIGDVSGDAETLGSASPDSELDQDSEDVAVDDVSEVPDGFYDGVLDALFVLHDDLQDIIMNDSAYHEQYIALQEQYSVLQEQYTEFQETTIELQYHMLASNIAIGFTLMLTLGYTVAHGFLQRMKVG